MDNNKWKRFALGYNGGFRRFKYKQQKCMSTTVWYVKVYKMGQSIQEWIK